jgi:hypothetical protein
MILLQKHKTMPATHEAVVMFKQQLDIANALSKFGRLCRSYATSFSIILFRELSAADREHWHMIIRGNITKKTLRFLLMNSLCDSRQNGVHTTASSIIDLHFEPIRPDTVEGLFMYTAKATHKSVKGINLFPHDTRHTRNINEFYAPREQDELWKEWYTQEYPDSHPVEEFHS